MKTCVSCQSFVVKPLFLPLMYRSNRSFNMPPRAFDFFENYCSNSPLPGPKCRSNALHWGPFTWSNAPTPETFHRHKNDRRTAETPSVVEQNLYKYNKNWGTVLVYLLRTNLSCKVAEIATTRSLNAQLFFVMQRTKRSIKKIPAIEITTSWPFHWHASSLTLLSNILKVGQSSWPELFVLFYFMLLYWIAGIGIVFHCRHNNKIHSYIQSLNPILKISKFKYFKYATKLV